jgi:hypothetical protein
MYRYDPLVAPNPQEWLAVDEQERIDSVVAYHRRAGIRVPNQKVHARVHVVVENQVAAGDELPVRRTAQRLMREGLDRHEVIHAIGWVLINYIADLIEQVDAQNADASRRSKPSDADPNAAYFAEIERLTAEAWRQSFQ